MAAELSNLYYHNWLLLKQHLPSNLNILMLRSFMNNKNIIINKKNRVGKRIGIDQAGESESRYGDIPTASTLDQSMTDRETELHQNKKGKTDSVDIETGHGNGSKTEGAFGRDHSGKNSKENARYREDI